MLKSTKREAKSCFRLTGVISVTFLHLIDAGWSLTVHFWCKPMVKVSRPAQNAAEPWVCPATEILAASEEAHSCALVNGARSANWDAPPLQPRSQAAGRGGGGHLIQVPRLCDSSVELGEQLWTDCHPWAWRETGEAVWEKWVIDSGRSHQGPAGAQALCKPSRGSPFMWIRELSILRIFFTGRYWKFNQIYILYLNKEGAAIMGWHIVWCCLKLWKFKLWKYLIVAIYINLL